MKYIIVASLAAILCLLGAIPVVPSSAQEAQEIPPLPHAFYGNVTINGTAAPNGTVVEANGTGVLTGIEGNPITVTEAGKYGGPGGFDPKLVVQGKNITDLTFYVNNVIAECYDVQAGGEWVDSYPFDSGNVTELNLKVGVAPAPDISVSPTAKNFGNITVGSSSPQTFNVSNVGYASLVVGVINITGTNADQFAIQNDNVSNQTIIPEGSATLQVVFSPTSTGAKSATLNIPSNDPDEPTVQVSLNGTGVITEPDISVSPTAKDFGNITVGSSSAPQTFNVSNVGYAGLVVGAINITGTNADQFTIQNDNVSNETIIPNGSATLQVVFSPTSTGAKSATLNFPSNDPGEPTVLVSLNGTGVPPAPDISVSPTTKNFGSIKVGSSSSPQTFNVSNVGSANLTVGTINITGTNADQFAIQNDNVSNETIIPNGSATLQVVFSPTSTGAKSATLNISSNDPDEATVLVPLNGTGVPPAPDISVSPTTKNFGSIKVGASSSPQTFNVSNVGNADLVVGTINITGTNANQFTIQNDNVSNQTIIPGGSATLQVVFSPTSTGAKSATLNISSNDPDEATVLVPLSGTGKTVAPGPGGGGGAAYYLRVNMLGDISRWDISRQGNLLEPLEVSSADNKVTISLGKGASCLNKEDNRLSTITISNQTDWPSVPEDYDIIGAAYEFQPAGAKFAPALSLTLSYVDNDVPQYLSEEDIYIAYYDATAENWVPLTSQVDTENNIVDAPVSHFTTFAIMGAAVPPTPANFSVTSLDLSSEQVEPGQEVLVTVNVTNIGGCEGSYALDLTINGEVEQTKTVTLAPSASDTVTFTVIKEEPGSYTISVDGLTKEFSVAAVAPSWISRYWWIILLGIIAIALVVYFQWRPRRAICS